MKKIIFAKDKDDKVVSVFDVPSGLACNCTCLDCGNKLISFHKAGGWYFGHEEYSNCKLSDTTSMIMLVAKTLESLGHIVVPELSYTFRDNKVILKEGYVFLIKEVKIVKLFKNCESTIIISDKDGNEIYIDVYFRDNKHNSVKAMYYRENNIQALNVKLRDDMFGYYADLSDIFMYIEDIFESSENNCCFWKEHPLITEINRILEDKGYHIKSSKEISKVYCCNREKLVDVADCNTCPFKIKLTSKELHCRGTLSKEDLLKLDSSIVFPPEFINYAGRCSSCNSDYTYLKENSLGVLSRYCNDCGSEETVLCPICNSILNLKVNKDERYKSYMSKFIGCTECSFTVTYKTANDDFADEIKFIGGIDNLRKDKSQYKKLIDYRNARKK